MLYRLPREIKYFTNFYIFRCFQIMHASAAVCLNLYSVNTVHKHKIFHGFSKYSILLFVSCRFFVSVLHICCTLYADTAASHIVKKTSHCFYLQATAGLARIFLANVCICEVLSTYWIHHERISFVLEYSERPIWNNRIISHTARKYQIYNHVWCFVNTVGCIGCSCYRIFCLTWF